MKPIAYPQPSEFIKALAKPFDGEDFSQIVKEFGLSWTDGEQLAPGLEVYNFSLNDAGVRFTFEDEGVLLDREGHDPGAGPFVLTKCTFWGHQDEVKPYSGPLWRNISFDDSLETAVRKLGEPSKINKRDNVYFWEYPGFRLTINWEGDGKIRVVTYWMKKN